MGYLDDQCRLWLGKNLPDPPVVPDHLARLFLRTEERESPYRNGWRAWEASCSDNYHRGCLWVAELDRWLRQERQKLLAEGHHLEPLWPDGKPFAMYLSHDIDKVSNEQTYEQVLRATEDKPRSKRRVWFRNLKGRYSQTPDLRDSMEEALRIETERGVVSSWFFTAYPVSRAEEFDCVYVPEDPCLYQGQTTTIAGVMRSLAARGHDVGLHGSYWSAREAGMLERQRQFLQKATGLDIHSTRQHWLHFDVAVTPGLQAQAGLEVDGTFGFNRHLGFRAGTSLPFFWSEHPTLLEVPLVLQDVALFSPSAMELDLETSNRVCRQITSEVASVGGCVGVLLHPEQLPLVPWLGSWYDSLIENAQSQGGWVTSLAEINDWWRVRAKKILNA